MTIGVVGGPSSKDAPERGQFLSPDTLVPDAGLVLDDNRYRYARGNPVKYTDPSGHCAVLNDGSPDTENDAGCWDAAKEWYRTFGGGDYQSEEEWLRYFASKPDITEQILRSGLYDYWAPQYETWRIPHAIYNPPPTVIPDEVHNPELRMPGDELVKTIVVDVIECSESVAGCGKALTDISTGLSGVAALCGIAGLAPCSAVASTASTVASSAGIVLTLYNIPNGNSSTVDMVVSTTAFVLDERYGDAGEYTVGLGISILEWIYEHWD